MLRVFEISAGTLCTRTFQFIPRLLSFVVTRDPVHVRTPYVRPQGARRFQCRVPIYEDGWVLWVQLRLRVIVHVRHAVIPHDFICVACIPRSTMRVDADCSQDVDCYRNGPGWQQQSCVVGAHGEPPRAWMTRLGRSLTYRTDTNTW
jgi:hypothetical protein